MTVVSVTSGGETPAIGCTVRDIRPHPATGELTDHRRLRFHRGGRRPHHQCFARRSRKHKLRKPRRRCSDRFSESYTAEGCCTATRPEIDCAVHRCRCPRQVDRQTSSVKRKNPLWLGRATTGFVRSRPQPRRMRSGSFALLHHGGIRRTQDCMISFGGTNPAPPRRSRPVRSSPQFFETVATFGSPNRKNRQAIRSRRQPPQECPKAPRGVSFRKEVIQPQVPLRLPCYDLVPIAEFILGAWLLAVTSATSDAPHFRGLTGGVYKAQEHIHRGMLTRDY